MNREFLLSVGLLSGTIIGAGIFSLPYVVSEIGLVTGLFYLLFFALVYSLIFLMYAELTLTTNDEHRFFYLAERFLPRSLAAFASLAIIVGLILTLTIYLILAASFFSLITGISASLALFLFWLFGSVFIFAKLSFQGLVEVFGTASILAITILIFFSGSSLPDTPFFGGLDLTKILLPFGPLLFAFSARVAIPRVVGVWKKAKLSGRVFSLKGAIFSGTYLPALIYFLFVFGVLRITSDVSPEALNGLTSLSPTTVIIMGILGILTLWTSYFMIGADVRENLKYDLKAPGWLSSVAVLFLPVGLYFLGLRDFLSVLGFTGGVFLGLEGIFIIMMWRRAFPSHRFSREAALLYLVFFAALLYSLIDFVL